MYDQIEFSIAGPVLSPLDSAILALLDPTLLVAGEPVDARLGST